MAVNPKTLDFSALSKVLVGAGSPGARLGRLRWAASPCLWGYLLKTRMPTRSVSARADHVVKDVLVLCGHHVGGEARLKLLATAFPRNTFNILDRLHQVVELSGDQATDAVAQD